MKTDISYPAWETQATVCSVPVKRWKRLTYKEMKGDRWPQLLYDGVLRDRWIKRRVLRDTDVLLAMTNYEAWVKILATRWQLRIFEGLRR